MFCPCRVTREGKERRKRWAERRTSSKPDKQAPQEIEDQDAHQSEENETHTMPGMLPSSVIEMLAAREKYVHISCTISYSILLWLSELHWLLCLHLPTQANLPLRL